MSMSNDSLEKEEGCSHADSNVIEKSIVLLHGNRSKDITVLEKGFNLHGMPDNYLTKRSKNENIIFHAVMSDALKSPFSGFTIASSFLHNLHCIDFISGMNSLKALARLPFSRDQCASIMVHRIGNTWILNEFDVDSFLLKSQFSREWTWLRKFLTEENLRLCSESLSRNVLVLRDLYMKFLYHTVGEFPSLSVPSLPSTAEKESEFDCNNQVDRSPLYKSRMRSVDEQITDYPTFANDLLIQKTSAYDSFDGSVRVKPKHQRNSKQPWTTNPDEFICMAKWQLQDLSLVVGSDLAIFGTPMHPCISLKLSPLHEPINVLTGVDIWLENLLNEVPEVAMCYHHEGIVMQEYKIYMTNELPTIAGFQSQQVYNSVQNLLMFFKRNATEEGHTYWMVKEAGLDIVKLYDLTTLSANDSARNDGPVNIEEDSDPFILPVASLCYRLAERRWQEYGALCNGTSAQTDSYVDMSVDKTINVLSDALRLLSNCLNLISVLEETLGHDCPPPNHLKTSSSASTASLWSRPRTRMDVIDLKMRAILLLCRFYLASPSHLMTNCIRRIRDRQAPRHGAMATMHVDELAKRPPQESDDTPSMSEKKCSDRRHAAEEQELRLGTEHDLVELKNSTHSQCHTRRLGNILIEAFQVPDSKKLSQLAVALLDTSTAFIPLTPSSPYLSPEEMNNLPETVWLHMLTGQSLGKNTEQNAIMLPFVLLKSYLQKATHLWTCHRHSQSSKSEMSNKPLEGLSVFCDIFRYTLPSILMLEHVVPDRFCTTTSASDSVLFTCPACQSPNSQQQVANSCWPIGKIQLTELLGIASQLLSVSVFHYSNSLRRLIASGPSQKLCTLDEDISAQQTLVVEKSDLLLLRAGCPASLDRLCEFFKSAIKYLTEYTNLLIPPAASNACIVWLDFVTYFIRSTCRALWQSIGVDRCPTKKTTLAKRHKSGLITTSDISSSWVPAFVNMYVIALRSLWLDTVGEAQKQASDAPLIAWETFNAKMDFGLRLVIGDLSVEFRPPDKADCELLLYTNEFQLLKLAAAASQFERSTSPTWTHHFEQLVEQYKPVLPVQTLVWSSTRSQASARQCKGRRRTTTDEPKRYDFSLTAVCLARTIDAMLRHHLAPSEMLKSDIYIHLWSNLLNAANEFLSSCIDINNDEAETDSAFLSTVYQVLKQVARYIPDEFVTASSSISERQSLSMPQRNLATVLLDFRQSQMNVAIRQHRVDHMSSDYGARSSAPPAWTTVINQARRAAVTWIEWNAWDLKQLSANACPSDGQLFKQLLAGISSLISLVNRLITLQAVNLDVLSISGLLAILRDISLTQPVMSAVHGQLQHFHRDCGTDNYPLTPETEESLKRIIQSLFCNLISIAQLISKKLSSTEGGTVYGGAGSRAPRQRRKAVGHVATGDKQDTTSTGNLVDGLLGSPDGLRDICLTSLEDLITACANMELDSLRALCSVVKEKMDYLSMHFSNR